MKNTRVIECTGTDQVITILSSNPKDLNGFTASIPGRYCNLFNDSGKRPIPKILTAGMKFENQKANDPHQHNILLIVGSQGLGLGLKYVTVGIKRSVLPSPMPP